MSRARGQSRRGGHFAYARMPRGTGLQEPGGSEATPSPYVDAAPAGGPRDGWAASPSAPRRAILLVCAPRLQRECLESVLRAKLPGVHIVSVAHPRPFAAWSDAAPILALIDASGPHADDRPLLKAIAEVLAAAPTARLLILSEGLPAIDVASLAKLGVAGAFPVSRGAALLIVAIRLALEGGRFELDSLPQNDSPARRSGDATLPTARPAPRSQRRDGQA